MNEEQKGIVFDIHRSTLHDGPGLRSTVFLKGCPLRCAWCHNPESQSGEIEIGASGKVYGRVMTVQDVMEKVIRDRAYYEATGGGVTLSGGEATQQFGFCVALLKALKAEGIHTCLDSCGAISSERLEILLPLVDLWHYDYKATGTRKHQELTGVGNRQILRNLAHLIETGARVRLRCPIVPGANDSEEHMEALEEFERSGRFESVERLPYHDFGESKCRDLGRAPFVIA